jgi:hypothetical protein
MELPDIIDPKIMLLSVGATIAYLYMSTDTNIILKKNISESKKLYGTQRFF